MQKNCSYSTVAKVLGLCQEIWCLSHLKRYAILHGGEMSEWSNVPLSKTCEVNSPRGFESHLLRPFFIFNYCPCSSAASGVEPYPSDHPQSLAASTIHALRPLRRYQPASTGQLWLSHSIAWLLSIGPQCSQVVHRPFRSSRWRL